jgi:hypothetical protein
MTENPPGPAAPPGAYSSAPRLNLMSSQRTSHTDRLDARPHRSAEDGLSGWARRWLRRLERALSGTAPDRVLSYQEVVDHLAATRPAGPGPVRGALLRRQRTGACEFRILCLDENDEPLTDGRTGRTIGFAVLARDCDEELHKMFGYTDLIIFDLPTN